MKLNVFDFHTVLDGDEKRRALVAVEEDVRDRRAERPQVRDDVRDDVLREEVEGQGRDVEQGLEPAKARDASKKFLAGRLSLGTSDRLSGTSRRADASSPSAGALLSHVEGTLNRPFGRPGANRPYFVV